MRISDWSSDVCSSDLDVEQVAAVAQPVLGNQQVPGAGDRQELGDAFDDAKQQGGEQVGHGGPGMEAGVTGYGSAIRFRPSSPVGWVERSETHRHAHTRGDDVFRFALTILRTASRPWSLPPGSGAPEPAVSSYRTNVGRHAGRTHRAGAKQLAAAIVCCMKSTACSHDSLGTPLAPLQHTSHPATPPCP